uniref:F-box domain-containing protein n=1 Tax=Plectus sambesii TaxID=2011161 RepID=A0A914WP87_9BILA
MVALETEVARLQAQNDQLRRTLDDIRGQIVCGQLTGKLPDNFLEQFSQLPDRPLEQVLRFLPARQVVQMRLVSRKFNHLIRKCSKTMPKKECNGSVAFDCDYAKRFTVGWYDDCGRKITTTQLAGNNVALSELLRFIRIDGLIFFGRYLSATSEVLHHLSKAWLTIRPEVVIFAGDLSQTSRDSLRAFLVKVEPFIRRLHFQQTFNIGNLLSDDLIGAAGRLDCLMVVPACWGAELRNINIGDETLLSMADANHMPSYFCFFGCSGITPGGIRAFVEKWMKKESQTPDKKAFNYGGPLELCELTFYNCANVTQAAVEEACRDLLKKETIAGVNTSSVDDSRETNLYVGCSIQYVSNNRCLDIIFHYKPFLSHIVDDPRVKYMFMVDDELDNDDLDPETEEDEDEDEDDDDDDDDDWDMEIHPMGTLEAEVDRLQAENDRIKRALADFSERIVCGRLTGYLPDNFLEQFSQLPDWPLEQVLRFLPARQVPQMRHVSRRFNHLIRKCSKTMPKKRSKGLGSVLFKANHASELTVEWFDNNGGKINEATLVGDEVALSELLRFMRIDGLMYFGEGLSAADEVLDQLSKAWLTIRPLVVILAGDLSKTSRDSLRAFLIKVEPFVTQIQFQNAYNIPDSLVSDDLIDAAGRLDGLMIKSLCSDSELCDINIGDDTLLAMVDSDEVLLHFFVMGCSGITPAGIRAFAMKWMGKKRSKADGKYYDCEHGMELCQLAFYKCANMTVAAIEKECGFLLGKAAVYRGIDDTALDDNGLTNSQRSMEVLEAEVARVQAENDQLRRTLADFNERIVCGRLTGDLPDNFLEQFNQLPDRPLEQVLRFLPAHQVVQMRHVSRKFNNLIRKCSSTMPKKERNCSVVFKSKHPGKLTVGWVDTYHRQITTTAISLAGDEVALSELLRFIRFGRCMHFSHGLPAADEVLDQLSKAWLTIRPEVVLFSGDLSHTSRDSLRAFLVKMEPSIKRLHFYITKIDHSLLSDDVIGAAGQLDGLLVMPLSSDSDLCDINIGDETLLSMADASRVSSYFGVMGCSGFTPSGIRAFVEKWIKNERLKPEEKTLGFRIECKLAFYKCANITPAAIEEACSDLLANEPVGGFVVCPFVDKAGENSNQYRYAIECASTNCFLEICFNSPAFSQFLEKLRPKDDDDEDGDSFSEFEDDDFDAYSGYDATDYIEDSDLD